MSFEIRSFVRSFSLINKIFIIEDLRDKKRLCHLLHYSFAKRNQTETFLSSLSMESNITSIGKSRERSGETEEEEEEDLRSFSG